MKKGLTVFAISTTKCC